MSENYLQGRNGHYLKNRSSYTVVVLRSLRHGSCVVCGTPLNSLDEAYEHWDEMLNLKSFWEDFKESIGRINKND